MDFFGRGVLLPDRICYRSRSVSATRFVRKATSTVFFFLSFFFILSSSSHPQLDSPTGFIMSQVFSDTWAVVLIGDCVCVCTASVS